MAIGVVIGRFQVPQLHEGHIAILSMVAAKSSRLVVLVGSTPAPLNAHDPLPVFCRADAIRALFPNALVLPLEDCPSDQTWSEHIDMLLSPLGQPCRLYGGRDSCLPAYKGKFPIEPLTIELPISGTQVREATDLGYSFEFRMGMVYAARVRFPTSYQAVDIAVVRRDSSTLVRQVLLGRKLGQPLWRLPGGFMDPADISLEWGAARELKEECGGALEVSDLRYVGSTRVSDWRYRGSVDSIMTALFACDYEGGTAYAGDDLAEVQWFDAPAFSLLCGQVVPEHHSLLNMLELRLDRA